MTYVIVGGDLRSIELARLLVLDKNNVSVIGFTKDMLPEGVNVTDSVLESDIVVLPMVVSYDDETINAPYSDTSIKITDILDQIKGQMLILGKASNSVMDNIKNRGIR